MRHEGMRSAVKAKAIQAVLLRQVRVDGVMARPLGNPGMKGGVKDGNVRNIWELFFCRLDAREVLWVVQRRQRDAGGDGGDDVVGDQRRVLEALAAVHHAMPHRVHLGVAERAEDGVDRARKLRLLDALHLARDQRLAAVGAAQLILHAR